MNTLERIRQEQQERYAKQREANKAKIEAMFSNNARPLNNNYELKKAEN
jgi:pyridoxine/pyridoxamine 5'-phosphate oxidase